MNCLCLQYLGSIVKYELACVLTDKKVNAFLAKIFMQLTEAVHHLKDKKMTFARLCNYVGYAIIRYAIKRVRL